MHSKTCDTILVAVVGDSGENYRAAAKNISHRISMESELFHYDFAGVPCEQRDRLMRLYLDAVRKLNELRQTVPNPGNEKRREATEEMKDACRAVLADLAAHRKGHGC
jgi:hypothetical protein